MKLAWLLRTYRTFNLTMRFSKYEFYNKLLGGVTLLRLTFGVIPSNVTPNFDKSTIRLHYLRIFSITIRLNHDYILWCQ